MYVHSLRLAGNSPVFQKARRQGLWSSQRSNVAHLCAANGTALGDIAQVDTESDPGLAYLP